MEFRINSETRKEKNEGGKEKDREKNKIVDPTDVNRFLIQMASFFPSSSCFTTNSRKFENARCDCK